MKPNDESAKLPTEQRPFRILIISESGRRQYNCPGVDGGDEMDENNVPKILKHNHYFGGDAEIFDDDRSAYAPLIWQCRYGGIEVPEPLWAHATSGKGKKYSDNQSENVVKDDAFMQTFNKKVSDFETFVTKKGKVPPGKWRAYGYKPPTNLIK